MKLESVASVSCSAKNRLLRNGFHPCWRHPRIAQPPKIAGMLAGNWRIILRVSFNDIGVPLRYLPGTIAPAIQAIPEILDKRLVAASSPSTLTKSRHWSIVR